MMNQGLMRIHAGETELRACNAVSEPYGLALSEEQALRLVQREQDTLRAAGRISFGSGILAKLAFAFCDSPFIQRDEYADTLDALQEDFYAFKNESEDLLSDDELVEAMASVFNGSAQGSLEMMEELTFGDLCRAARGGCGWKD